MFILRDRLGFVYFISCFLYITMFLWIPLSWTANTLFGLELSSDEIYMPGLWLTLLFFNLYIFLSLFLTRNVRASEIPIYPPDVNKLVMFISLFVFIMATLGYVAINGISFSAGNYGDRLASNAGNGIFMIFFYLFIPAAFVILLTYRTKGALITASGVAILGGVAVYFILGGSRNVLAAALLGTIILAQRLKLISLSTLFSIVIALIFVINYLAFVRYGQGLDDSTLELGFRYLIDSLSPYDSFNNIITFYNESDEEFLGLNNIAAQFYGLVPRVLWPEKPIVPLTNALYYTDVILGSSNESIIISPTLVGGFYMMAGSIGMLLGLIFLLAFSYVLEVSIFSSKPFPILICYTLLPYSFFMMRESLELFIYKVIITLFTFTFVWSITVVFQSIKENMYLSGGSTGKVKVSS